MGKGASKPLNKKDLEKFLTKSHFDEKEIQGLYAQYIRISKGENDDGVIDKAEFQQALGLKDSVFIDRMFYLFDKDHNGSISFDEFVIGLSVFSEKASKQEKMEFAFKIFDADNDGFISQKELFSLLSGCLKENGLGIPEQQLDALVTYTLQAADLDKDGKISFHEYCQYAKAHPGVLSNMTISTNIHRPQVTTI